MPTIRIAAALAAAALVAGCRAKEAGPDVSALVRDLQGSDEVKSGQANLALIRTGEPAVPALVDLLRSGDPRLRRLAASTFWGMGAKARAAVPALAEMLQDPDPQFRVMAAMAFENMGPAAVEAVPVLTKALGDGDLKVRQASVKALGAIGPDARAAVPVLKRAVKRASWPEAEEALARIEGRAIGTPPDLSDVPSSP
jgi:HEAT repeat protein